MAAIEAAGLQRTYKTHTGTFRRRAKEIEAVRGIDFAASYALAGYALLRWFEILSRRYASLERS